MATAAAVAFVVYSCQRKLEVADEDMTDTPVMTVDSMYVIQTENGKIQMRMEADIMERYQRGDTLTFELFPKGIAVYGYNEDGLLESEILADNAKHSKFRDGRESWSAFGNVILKNVMNQEIMETDTLYWDQKNEKLYTDCYVRMYSPDGFMQGYGMESDQKAKNSVILKPFNSYGYVVQDSTDVAIDTVNFIGPLQKK
ncbi:MAG: LPS export ABC transporter periplasmic protein LptC [Bacteroidales bacterium]|nr:LPS export ABC transporter periplasmic protein LptC [Bacteroidales bacterium]